MRILKTQRSRGGRRNSNKFGNRSSPRNVLRNRCENGGEKFSEKLQALKSLLPPSTTTTTTTTETKTVQSRHVEEKSDSGETEQLFQETADYIVRLRNQVVVLQKLIKIYGSSSDQTGDFVL